MSYEMTGKLHLINATEEIKGFIKREFVIIPPSDYPQHIKFEFKKEKCILLDSFKVGQDVKVTFFINGREWNEKYFTNLVAIRIESMGPAPSEVIKTTTTDKDEMPF